MIKATTCLQPERCRAAEGPWRRGPGAGEAEARATPRRNSHPADTGTHLPWAWHCEWLQQGPGEPVLTVLELLTQGSQVACDTACNRKLNPGSELLPGAGVPLERKGRLGPWRKGKGREGQEQSVSTPALGLGFPTSTHPALTLAQGQLLLLL